MDNRLENKQDTILSGTDRSNNEHSSECTPSTSSRENIDALDIPIMVNGEHYNGISIMDSVNHVAYGPNVNIYGNERHRYFERNTLGDEQFPWIFVTGSSGFVGSIVSANLKSNTNYNVMAIDRRSKMLPHTSRYCDTFADEDFVSHLILQSMRDYKPKCVVHLAASSTIPPSLTKPLEYWDNNVTKTLRLIESCVDHGIKNIIFASTSSVYGDSDQAVDENFRCYPTNAYSKTKYTIEMALQDAYKAHGLNSISFRFFNAAGAHPLYDLGELPGSSHLIARIMEAATQNIPFNIFGRDYNTPDGTAIRDYTHVMDIADAITTGIEWIDHNPGSHIINLGAGKGYSVQQVVDTAEQLLNKQLPYRYANRRPGDTEKRFADISKAKNTINWSPRRSLNDIILDSYKWYKTATYMDLVQQKITVDL